MKQLKQYGYLLVIGILFNIFDNSLCSGSIVKYLRYNIIGLIVTVIALNLTAVIFLFSRLTDDFNGGFNDTISEIHLSIKEQIISIPITLILLSITTERLSASIIPCFSLLDWVQSIIIGVFALLMHSIWDISNATFLFVKYLNRN